ncbi:MAG TPA: LacI family DNA-binding transcriptional regulator [Gaiellaceae bacterium]|nr:LacI family DNA-binding transcriptional regulator [Gaiellaceae bacterium]
MGPNEGRRVRLRDVAERAGVSVGTASQAFGHPELVSEQLRERVHAAAEALGYPGPDPAARRLRLGRTGVLGLLFAERLGYQFTDPAAPAFLRGVARGMQRAPLGLLLLPDSRYRREASRAIREAAVDGFIVYSAPQNDPRVEAALDRQLPVVTVDQPRDAPTPFVGIDDRAAARGAAEYLRGLGHERVAVLSFIRALDPEGTLVLDISIERLEGYEQGLGEAWNDSLVRICRPNAAEPARRAALELLRQPLPPTAILAMSDVLAIGALQAAAELGVAVPEALSLVGFDDSPAAALARPPLTTVAQPHEEKGRLAAERLLDEIAHRTDSKNRLTREILPTELVVRRSTAPPLGSID